MTGGRELPAALDAAMSHALAELGKGALTPGTTVVAVMADHMIRAGWPATLEPTPGNSSVLPKSPGGQQ